MQYLITQLTKELENMTASRQSWQERLNQALQAQANAQRTLDMHDGHIERLKMTLQLLANKAKESQSS